MKIWYIYKITNLLTNKSYVGQRLKRNDKDSSSDGYWGSGTYLKHSIKKHGLENFKKEILKDNIRCQTAANIFEEIYIKQENTLAPNGYNLKSSCNQNCIISEETKKKISNSLKDRTGATKGKRYGPISEKHKEKIKNYWNNLTQEQKLKKKEIQNKTHIGRKNSEETLIKMRKSALGNPKKKGHTSWRKGRKFTGEKRSEKARENIRAARKLLLEKAGLKTWTSVKNRKQLKVGLKLRLKINKTHFFEIKALIEDFNSKKRKLIYYVLDNNIKVCYFDVIKNFYIERLEVTSI